VIRGERLLQRVFAAEALDGADLLAVALHGEHQARADGLAPD
jgi:hypothetical protein